MNFRAYQVAVEIVRSMRSILDATRAHDGDLAHQMKRAAQSVPLNVAEGRERGGRDRLHHYRVALGSTGELLAALDVAVAFGYVDDAAVAPARASIDEERAILWRLIHPR